MLRDKLRLAAASGAGHQHQESIDGLHVPTLKKNVSGIRRDKNDRSCTQVDRVSCGEKLSGRRNITDERRLRGDR